MFAHTINTILSGAVLVLAPVSVSAQSPRVSGEGMPEGRSISGSSEGVLDSFEERLQAEGFRLVELEYYASKIEVKGYDSRGYCMEIYFDRTTGRELRREHDDSCNRSRGDRRSRDD